MLEQIKENDSRARFTVPELHTVDERRFVLKNIVAVAERIDEEVFGKEYTGYEHLRQLRYEICSCCSNNLRYKQQSTQLRVCYMCRLPVCPTCVCSFTRNKQDGLLEIQEQPLCQTCLQFNQSIMVRNSDIHVKHPDIHLTDPRCGICSTKRQYSFCTVVSCVCNTFGSLCREHTYDCKRCTKPYCIAHLLKHVCHDKTITSRHVPLIIDSRLPSKKAMKRQRKREREQLVKSEQLLETMKSESYSEAFTLMPPATFVPSPHAAREIQSTPTPPSHSSHHHPPPPTASTTTTTTSGGCGGGGG